MKEERSAGTTAGGGATLLRPRKFARLCNRRRGSRRGGTKMVEGIKNVGRRYLLSLRFRAATAPATFPRELLFPLENSPSDEPSSPRHPRIAIKLFATGETA